MIRRLLDSAGFSRDDCGKAKKCLRASWRTLRGKSFPRLPTLCGVSGLIRQIEKIEIYLSGRLLDLCSSLLSSSIWELAYILKILVNTVTMTWELHEHDLQIRRFCQCTTDASLPAGRVEWHSYDTYSTSSAHTLKTGLFDVDCSWLRRE